MIKSHNWCKRHKQIHFFCEVVREHGRANKKLSCALRMANIGGKLTDRILTLGLVKYIIDLSGHIVNSHFFKIN